MLVPLPALGLSADQQADRRGHGPVPLLGSEPVRRGRVLGEAHRHRRWAGPLSPPCLGCWRCLASRGGGRGGATEEELVMKMKSRILNGCRTSQTAGWHNGA